MLAIFRLKYESQELEDFIKSTIESILKGVDEVQRVKTKVVDLIEFELAVVTTKTAEGGFRIFVADASGKVSKESISEIKFKVGRAKVKNPMTR